METQTSEGNTPSRDDAPFEAGNADMEVTGPGAAHGAFPIRPARSAIEPKPAVGQPSAPIRDEIEISSAGKMLEKLSDASEVRAEHLARIKAAIDAGEYETPHKLEAALDRLLDEIGFNDKRLS